MVFCGTGGTGFFAAGTAGDGFAAGRGLMTTAFVTAGCVRVTTTAFAAAGCAAPGLAGVAGLAAGVLTGTVEFTFAGEA